MILSSCISNQIMVKRYDTNSINLSYCYVIECFDNHGKKIYYYYNSDSKLFDFQEKLINSTTNPIEGDLYKHTLNNNMINIIEINKNNLSPQNKKSLKINTNIFK